MNRYLFLLMAALLTGCGRENIKTPTPLPESKEFVINDNGIPVMVLKMERISDLSFSSNTGSEFIKLYVRSIDAHIDSAILSTVIKIPADTIIYHDTNTVYDISIQYQLIDSFYSTRYNTTIDIYNATSNLIKKAIDKTGNYKGFAEIFSDGHGSYFKQFECDVKPDNKMTCTISSDTLRRFEGYLFNNDKISGKLYSDSDSAVLDYNNTFIKIHNDSLTVRIDFSTDSNSIFKHLKFLFNGKK